MRPELNGWLRSTRWVNLLMSTMIFTSAILVSCTPEQPAPLATPVTAPTHSESPQAERVAAPGVTPVLAATATTRPKAPTPTNPPSPQPTTPQASATPLPFTAQTLRWVDVYAGPGQAYPVLASFAGGINFDAAARSQDGSWIQIGLSEFQPGWIAAQNVALSAATDNLVVVELPAQPETTATSQPVQKAKITANLDSTGNVMISGSGLQPNRYHILEFWTDKGKLKQKLGINATSDGGLERKYLYFPSSEWPNGTYTVLLSLNDVLVAQTTFTLQRKK